MRTHQVDNGQQSPAPEIPPSKQNSEYLGAELQTSTAKRDLQGKKDSLRTDPSQRATVPRFEQGLKEKEMFNRMRK